MKYLIAITSKTGEEVDLHFGQAKSFVIIEVDESDGTFNVLGQRYITEDTCENAKRSCKGRGSCAADSAVLDEISKLLKDCTYLLTAKIGNRAHRGLQQRGIHVLEIPKLPLNKAIEQVNQYYVSHKKREQYVF